MKPASSFSIFNRRILVVTLAIGLHAHMSMAAEAAPDQSSPKVLYWYDPMVPGTKFDKPGKSPFMDMELVPKYADDADGTAAGEKPIISIAADTIQKMGVRTAEATRSTVGKEVRATGIVMENERTRVDLFSQLEGRVDDLNRTEGDKVQAGDVLFTIASPEFVKLQQEYISALYSIDFTASKRLLQQIQSLGIDEQTIETIKRTERPVEKIPFYVPANGVLTKFDIRNGRYLKTGDEIGRIQDLSQVWVEASVDQGDASSVKHGAHIEVLLPDGSTKRNATVDHIHPEVNPQTRTVMIRLLVGNADGALKPGAYVSAMFTGGSSQRLTVPSEAVLRSSTGSHVIMALGSGKFQACDVKTGVVSGGQTEILDGLKQGDTVVTSAQFLIDSESSLRESLQKISPAQAPAQEMPKTEMPHGK